MWAYVIGVDDMCQKVLYQILVWSSVYQQVFSDEGLGLIEIIFYVFYM